MALDWHQYIHADAAILGGKPVIKGTRISVELLTERLADGWTAEDIRASYPHLPAEALPAVFAYLRENLAESFQYLLPRKSA